MKHRSRFLLMILVLAVCVPTAFAAPKGQSYDSGEVEKLIVRLELEGREATLKNDLQANDRLLASSWININPDGSITTKAQLLELLKAGTFKIQSIENDQVLIRVFGDAAIVTGRSTTERAGSDGAPLTRQVRFTRVYAKVDSRWQVVSAHNTLINNR